MVWSVYFWSLLRSKFIYCRDNTYKRLESHYQIYSAVDYYKLGKYNYFVLSQMSYEFARLLITNPMQQSFWQAYCNLCTMSKEFPLFSGTWRFYYLSAGSCSYQLILLHSFMFCFFEIHLDILSMQHKDSTYGIYKSQFCKTDYVGKSVN